MEMMLFINTQKQFDTLLEYLLVKGADKLRLLRHIPIKIDLKEIYAENAALVDYDVDYLEFSIDGVSYTYVNEQKMFMFSEDGEEQVIYLDEDTFCAPLFNSEEINAINRGFLYVTNGERKNDFTIDELNTAKNNGRWVTEIFFPKN